MTGLLYLEDFEVGQTFKTDEHALDAEQVVAFASQFDPQPFHTDDEAGKNSFFGGLAASGWHTAAITMSLMVRSGPKVAGGLIGAGAEVAWPRPSYPGDVLRVEVEVLEVNPSRSRPDRGMVKIRCTTVNQRGETAQIMTTPMLAFRRPAEEDA